MPFAAFGNGESHHQHRVKRHRRGRASPPPYYCPVFSVSPAEIVTIAVVALLVFGPRRLPEIARQAGRLLRQVRTAAGELKEGLEAEYQEALEPLEDVRREMSTTVDPPGPPPRPPAPEPGDPEEES